ncbi:MAG: hypothetical protein GF311_23090 [Candidatus Lokiarchaeota archaeon]|nr:hypothetical protein [Candidatus Lokiarchaeota archaeon]
MAKIPKIIFTKQLRGSNLARISLSARQFANLLKNEDLKILFSDLQIGPPHHRSTNYLYLIKEGIIFQPSRDEIEYLEDFFNIEKFNCEEMKQYLVCQYYEIDDYMKFEEFIEANFGLRKEDFDLFQEAKKYSFSNRKEYLEAKKFGIKDINEFKEWKSTDFDNYKDFIKARKGGFDSRREFNDAQKYNIGDINDYQKFIDKGLKELEKKIQEVENDSNRAFDNRNYKEFIRLMYLSIEKIVEIIYLRVIGEPIPNDDDLNTSDMIEQVQTKLGKDFNLLDKFHKWRLMRNDIVHENLDVNPKTAEEAREFYQVTKEKLMNQFYNFS